jgi:hypothetical protein
VVATLSVLATAMTSGCHVTSAALITMLDMTGTPDLASAGALGNIGDIDQLRLRFDTNSVDPATRRVALLNMQHFMNGTWSPATHDDVVMPMSDAWLDLSSQPYRFHYKAAVVHGDPIIIDVDPSSGRLSIHPQQDRSSAIESGRHVIDLAPIYRSGGRCRKSQRSTVTGRFMDSSCPSVMSSHASCNRQFFLGQRIEY